MTKAEAYIYNMPEWHLAYTGLLPTRFKDDRGQDINRSDYGDGQIQERMYLHQDGHKLFCNNGYGDSWLVKRYPDGSESGRIQIEHRYDDGTLESLNVPE